MKSICLMGQSMVSLMSFRDQHDSHGLQLALQPTILHHSCGYGLGGGGGGGVGEE